MFIHTEVFKAYGGGPKAMADKYKIPFLGKLPLDPGLLAACEKGVSYTETDGSQPTFFILISIVFLADLFNCILSCVMIRSWTSCDFAEECGRK